MTATDPPRAVDASPFDLAPERSAGDVAALCVHGLTGTPYEVRPVGEALASAGVRAVGVLLPGHNSSIETLARTASDDWMTAVRMAYLRLSSEHARVFVVGLSLGGLLTLHLAAHERVAGIAVIGTPLRLALPIRLAVPIARRFVRSVPKKVGSDIRDPEARARHPGYLAMPLQSVQELMRLQRRVRRALGRVSAPALIAHGAHDRTADPRDAERIERAIASVDKERLILDDSAHVVPVDYDGPLLSRRVAEFVAKRI